MDKAPAHGAGDSGFESQYGLTVLIYILCMENLFPSVPIVPIHEPAASYHLGNPLFGTGVRVGRTTKLIPVHT